MIFSKLLVEEELPITQLSEKSFKVPSALRFVPHGPWALGFYGVRWSFSTRWRKTSRWPQQARLRVNKMYICQLLTVARHCVRWSLKTEGDFPILKAESANNNYINQCNGSYTTNLSESHINMKLKSNVSEGATRNGENGRHREEQHKSGLGK